ncbi:MAG TPA: hypothetical protein VMC10_18225 [Stellaceae bacterium]|nr:hypothetical protein [Stellaceae bacterium]
MSGLDVLVITALPMEYEAARQVATKKAAAASGVSSWEEKDTQTPAPYALGNYVTGDSTSMSVGLARPTRMGGTPTGFVAASLLERLHPRCLAMCGVCAGNPSDVSLGDVIVAEMTYAYDEGKRNAGQFEPDHRQTPLFDDAWLRVFQGLSPQQFPSYGAPSARDARFWLLRCLYAGSDPMKNPGRQRHFPLGAWNDCVRALASEGLVRRSGRDLKLTKKGRDSVEFSLIHDIEPPEKLPFAIKVGPIASGNAVVKDGVTWKRLKAMGVRTVIGLEMEAATIGSAARLSKTPWIVVKGVMDYADPAKDDRYKPFAARASAEVLFEFLKTQYAKPVPPPILQSSAADAGSASANVSVASGAARDAALSRAYIAIIGVMFDAQYFLPGAHAEVRLARASYFIPDDLLAKIRPELGSDAPLAEVARYLVRTGQLGAALAYLTTTIRDSWDQIRPYAKLSLLHLAEKYPMAGLQKLPPLTAGELEIAGIKWFVADELFQKEWNAWVARISGRGLDLDRKTVAWNDFEADLKYYRDQFFQLLTARIGIDIALLQASTSEGISGFRRYLRDRAYAIHLRVIEPIDEICASYPNQIVAFEKFARPMREISERLLDNPLTVVPPPRWRAAIRKYL